MSANAMNNEVEQIRETLAMCAGALRGLHRTIYEDKETLERLRELGRYAEKLLGKEVTRSHTRKSRPPPPKASP